MSPDVTYQQVQVQQQEAHLEIAATSKQNIGRSLTPEKKGGEGEGGKRGVGKKRGYLYIYTQ